MMRDHQEISREVEAKYACTHSRKILRNKPDKNGRPMIAEQCLNCGARVGDYHPARTFSRAEIASMQQWDKALQTSYSSRKYKEMSALWQAEKDKEDDAWWEKYEAHLKTQKWKALRKKVIERAEGICEGCGENKATQAHHLTYERVGDEMLFDLVAVCDHCHDKVHKEKQKLVPEQEHYTDDDGGSGDDDLPF